MNGRQEFAFDRNRLLTGTLHTSAPTGLVMTAGSYSDVSSSPLLLPTPSSVMRTNLTDLARPPSTIGMASAHQQYHGRCTSSFSWNAGTNFSSFLNGVNFSSLQSSPVSPLHTAADMHNIRTVWPPVASNSDDLMLSSGIHLETILPYSQQLSHVAPAFSTLPQERNSPLTPFYAKGFDSPSYKERDMWTECRKGFGSDNNNNTSQNLSDVPRLGIQSKELFTNANVCSEPSRCKKAKSSKSNKAESASKKSVDRISPRNSSSHKRRKISDVLQTGKESEIAPTKACNSWNEIDRLASLKTNQDNMLVTSVHAAKKNSKKASSFENLPANNSRCDGTTATKNSSETPANVVVAISLSGAVNTTSTTTTTTLFTTTTTTTTITSGPSIITATTATTCHTTTNVVPSTADRPILRPVTTHEIITSDKPFQRIPNRNVHCPLNCKKKLQQEKHMPVVSSPSLKVLPSQRETLPPTVANGLTNVCNTNEAKKLECVVTSASPAISTKKNSKTTVLRLSSQPLKIDAKNYVVAKRNHDAIQFENHNNKLMSKSSVNISCASEPENLVICATEEPAPTLLLSPPTPVTSTIAVSSVSPSYSTIAEDLWKASEVTPETQEKYDDRLKCQQNSGDQNPIDFSTDKYQGKIPTLVAKPHRYPSSNKDSNRAVISLPGSTKPYLHDKKNTGQVDGSINLTTKPDQKSYSSKVKTTDKSASVHPNVQKVQPISISTENALPLVTKRNLATRNANVANKAQTQSTALNLSNSSVMLSMASNTNGVSSTAVAIPAATAQVNDSSTSDSVVVHTMPKSSPLTSSTSFDSVGLTDQSFLPTNKITPLKTDVDENLTIAQVLPISVIATNTCDKISVPVKTQEPLSENPIVLHNPTVSVNIPIGIAVARQRHEQTTTQTAGIVASTTPWEESSRSTITPWITSSHTSTYWLPQGNYAATTAPFPLQFNSPDLTHLPIPPLGFQLVRDSITGHLLLIPTNIDLTERPNLWSNYNTSAPSLQPSQQCHQIMIQQHVLQQDQQKPFEYRLPFVQQAPIEISKTQTTEMQTDEQEEIGMDAVSGESVADFSQEKSDDKEKSMVDFACSTDSISSVQLNSNASVSSESYGYSCTPSDTPYDYSSTGILQFAQAVQTDSGKRSQGTSPIPSDECSPPFTENIAQNLDDSNSGFESNFNMALEYGAAGDEMPQVADAGNQTETPPPLDDESDNIEVCVGTDDSNLETLDESCKPMQEDVCDRDTEESIVYDTESVCQTSETSEMSEKSNCHVAKESNLGNANIMNIDGCEKYTLEEHSKCSEESNTAASTSIEAIDFQGLQLLSNSITELEDSMNQKPTREVRETVPSFRIINGESKLHASIQNVDSETSQPKVDEVAKEIAIPNEEKSTSTETSKLPLEPSVPENMQGLGGLGLLCALAEQCIVEETKKTNVVAPEMPVPAKPTPHNVKIKEIVFANQSEMLESLDKNEREHPQNLQSSKEVVHTKKISAKKQCINNKRLMDFTELEMRMRLAELQKQYKEKQRQLAKLQPKKEKEELEKCMLKRGPGRPRKHWNPDAKKTSIPDINSMVKTFVRLEATPSLLDSDLDETLGIDKSHSEENLTRHHHSISILSPLKNKIVKKSFLKPYTHAKKSSNTTVIRRYLKRLRKTKEMKTMASFSVKKSALCLNSNNNLLILQKINPEKMKKTVENNKISKTNLDTCELPKTISPSVGPSETVVSQPLKEIVTMEIDQHLTKSPEIEDRQEEYLQPDLQENVSSHNAVYDNDSGLGLLAQFACRVVEETRKDEKQQEVANIVSEKEKVLPKETVSMHELPHLTLPNIPTKKRKPGRPKKPEAISSELEKKKNLLVKKLKVEIGPCLDLGDIGQVKLDGPKLLLKSIPSDSSSPDSSPPKASFLEDDAWNRRRSERIFLNDLNITPSGGYCDNKNMLSPPHLKPVSEELAAWKTKTNTPKNFTRLPDMPKSSSKKSTKTEICTKKMRKEQRKPVKNPSIPEELFQELQEKCCVSDSSNIILDDDHKNNTPEESDDYETTNEDVFATTEIEQIDDSSCSCKISCDKLVEGFRVLTLVDGLFYAGHLNVIEAPDIYGITFDGERGNRPHIYSQEEILKKAFPEIKAQTADSLVEGTRICAYWSQQYRCLYPGTVKRCTSPDPEADGNSVYVEFDDGDSGRIPISDICVLHRTFPIVSYGPSPLIYTGKRRYRSDSDKTNDKNNGMENKDIDVPKSIDFASSKLEKSSGTTHVITTKANESEARRISISNTLHPSMPSLVISAPKKMDEDPKTKSKKSKPESKHSSKTTEKSTRENFSVLTGYETLDVVKSKKHKKHKDKDRSDEHRHHHHHHHHHKHKHKHDRHEKHNPSNNNNSSKTKNKEKESASIKIFKTFESSGTVNAIGAIVKHPTFTAERKKSSELTVKIRTNSTDMSQLDLAPLTGDSDSWERNDNSSKKVQGNNDVDNSTYNEKKSKESSKESSTSQVKEKKNHLNRKRKRRPSSVESKSKMAAFLPARQLWRWAGNSFRRPGTKGKARKKFYKAITRGKETIVVGDCAVFLSTGRPHLPYIGRIELMWEAWGGNMVVRVKWFYHPEETKGGRRATDLKGALYQSLHVDENDVQTISHKCEVLSWNEYKKLFGLEVVQSAKYGNMFDNNDVYYLAGTYDPTTGFIRMEPSTCS